MFASKVILLALCVNQSFSIKSIRFDVKAEPINQVSTFGLDGESSIYGFSVDNEAFDVRWSSSDIKVSYNSVYCGTLRVDVGGVKMKEKLNNGNYAYGVLIRSTMSPRQFTLTTDGKSNTYRGRSRYLSIASSVSGSQKLIDVQPGNIAGSSSYTIGISGGADSSGLSGSISASTEIKQDALNISNTSSVIDGNINIEYEYKRHIWPWEWERTKYCWYDSVQRCSFFFSSSSSQNYKSIQIQPTFAIDDGNIGMWNLEMGYELTSNSYVTAYFPN